MAIKKLSSFGSVTSIDGDNDLVPISKYLSPGVYETRNAPANLVGVSNYADLTGTPSIGTNPLDLVQLDATGKLPAVDGSQLTNLPSSLSSPLTTKGDVWTYSTTDERLGVGTNGQVLKANSGTATGLEWNSVAYSEVTGKPTLGTAAALNVGTAANNVVQLDSSARLPAVDGSQLTNLPVSAVAGLSIVTATNGSTLTDIKGKVYLNATSGTTTVTLPASPATGDWCYFYRRNTDYFVIQRNGTQTINHSFFSADVSVDIVRPNGGWAFAVWTGTFWLFSGDVGRGQSFQEFGATRTSNFTISQSDHGLWIACNTNNLTVTLPNGLFTGTQVIIDRRGTATVTVTASTTLIGKNVSANSVQIANQYGVVHCVHTGSNIWRITGDL